MALPTPLGRTLLEEKTGLDPYLEDPTTLWVLHWQAVSAITSLPVWWAVFNDFPALEFTEDDLTSVLRRRGSRDELAPAERVEHPEGCRLPAAHVHQAQHTRPSDP